MEGFLIWYLSNVAYFPAKVARRRAWPFKLIATVITPFWAMPFLVIGFPLVMFDLLRMFWESIDEE